jgi:mono/diheme cytochrome c family protein
MNRRCAVWVAVVLASCATAAVMVVTAASSDGIAMQAQPGGWTLPADAEQKKSPLTVDEKVLAQGRAVFKDKCQKCHGPKGRGDGPDADPDHQEDMDLTVASRASKNPDGVIFYKVSNGRRRPKMPSFKDDLNEEQIWSVVAYVQTLRHK